MFLVFYGELRATHHDAHESPKMMLVPMCVLAVGCVVAGWYLPLIRWSEWPLMTISAVLAFLGIWLAWRYYIVSPESRMTWDARFSVPIRLLRNRWYIDALYEEHVVNGIIMRTAEGASAIDVRIIDAAVGSAAWIANRSSRVLRWIDLWIVDGAVRFTSAGVRAFSSPARALQTGLVQTYVLLFIGGLLAALGYYLIH
jgi:NADH-quinone oxidoreductase subunit L